MAKSAASGGPTGRGSDPVFADHQLDSIAIETAFVRDCLFWFDRTRSERAWRSISAPSGAGKSHSLRYFEALHAGTKEPTGVTLQPVVSIVTPHDRARGGTRLRERIGTELGVSVAAKRQSEATWIADRLCRSQTELLVLDDAHKLVPDDHIPALKEICDLYARASGGPRLGVVFLCATRRGEMLLRSIFEDGDVQEYGQYIGRSAPEERYVALHGLSEGGVAEALAGYEAFLRDSAGLPNLRLSRHAGDVFRYARLPALSPIADGYALMRAVRNFVGAIASRLIERGMGDIDPAGALIDEVGQALAAGSREVRGDGRAVPSPDAPAKAIAQ